MRLGYDLTPEVGDGGEVHPDADLEQEEDGELVLERDPFQGARTV